MYDNLMYMIKEFEPVSCNNYSINQWLETIIVHQNCPRIFFKISVPGPNTQNFCFSGTRVRLVFYKGFTGYANMQAGRRTNALNMLSIPTKRGILHVQYLVKMNKFWSLL